MKRGKETSTGPLEIRKYSNRRYYDTTRSRHLKLEDIRSLVRDGYSVRITDSKTGADITGQVLTQIILELETPKLASVPVSFLTQIIQMNDKMLNDFRDKLLTQPFQAWLEYQKNLQDRFRQLQDFQNFYPPFGAWPGTPPPFVNAAPNPPAAGAGGKSEPNPLTPEELRAVVEGLRNEIATLRQKVDQQKGKRVKKKNL